MTEPRPDLLGLSEDALVKLANAGLVKRALKQAAVAQPTIEVAADHTVIATFADGAVTRLPVGAGLRAAPCTCGATTVCRHRIGAVLAYQAQAATLAPASGPEFGTQQWDPGQLSDEHVLQVCGAEAVHQASTNPAVVVETQPGTANTPPTARLPTATVAFLVANDASFAKCDCAKGGRCWHIALAVLAFRACPAGGIVTVKGRGRDHNAAAVSANGKAQPFHDPASQLAASQTWQALRYIAQYGLLADGAAALLAQARASCEQAKWLWPALGVAALEQLAEQYQKQSAAFRLTDVAREFAELVGRLRCATAALPALPPNWVLGTDTAPSTAMDQVRLISLGCRLTADGDARSVHMYFVDPDTSTVLVLNKTWPNEPRVGHALGQLYASSKLSIANLSAGELVTRAAKRRANGALDLGAARGMQTSLLPATSGLRGLLPPVRVADLSLRRQALREAPPAILTPRALGSAIVVIDVGAILALDRSPDGQHVTAQLQDSAGNPFIVELAYRSVTPGAVDALTQVLQLAWQAGAANHAGNVSLTGELSLVDDTWVLAPLAAFTDRLIVLDLAPPSAPTPLTANVGRALGETNQASMDATATATPPLIAELADWTARTVLRGMRSSKAQGTALAAKANFLGLPAVAARLTACASVTDDAADALADLALLVTV